MNGIQYEASGRLEPIKHFRYGWRWVQNVHPAVEVALNNAQVDIMSIVDS